MSVCSVCLYECVHVRACMNALVCVCIDIVTLQGLETGIASVLRLTSQHISLIDHSHTIVHNRVFYLVYIQGVAIHLIKRHGAPHAYLRK